MIQTRAAWEKPRSARISGSATVTTVPSRTIITIPMLRAIKAIPRLSGMPATSRSQWEEVATYHMDAGPKQVRLIWSFTGLGRSPASARDAGAPPWRASTAGNARGVHHREARAVDFAHSLGNSSRHAVLAGKGHMRVTRVDVRAYLTCSRRDSLIQLVDTGGG